MHVGRCGNTALKQRRVDDELCYVIVLLSDGDENKLEEKR
jgi:hypothetical protein